MNDHAHDFQETTRDDGEAVRSVWSRCECGVGLRRRYFRGILYEIRYQITPLGDWIDPVALLELGDIHVRTCPTCKALPTQVRFCTRCRGLGVVNTERSHVITWPRATPA